MAVDELLLQRCGETGRSCWRFYRWREPTLSLGYFQQYEDRRQHPASAGCPAVRRLSGGGAILHHAELTYSVVLPVTHPLAKRRLRLYRSIHSALVETLAEWGISASIVGEQLGERPERQPFLCFQRRAEGDVVVAGSKIAGSAQRRTGGAVLQHGSVVLGRSPAAPEIDALDCFAGHRLGEQELAHAWLARIGDCLGFRFSKEPLSQAERRRADALVTAKYGSDGWTRDRGRRHKVPAQK